MLVCRDVFETSDILQAQLAPEEVQRKNAVGKGSITNLEHKAADATEVFADVSRFSRPTVVPHGQKSLWEMVVWCICTVCSSFCLCHWLVIIKRSPWHLAKTHTQEKQQQSCYDPKFELHPPTRWLRTDSRRYTGFRTNQNTQSNARVWTGNVHREQSKSQHVGKLRNADS